LLVAGCALVLALELPASWRAFFSGWRGPYAASDEDDFSARLTREAVRLAGLLFLVHS
jgi:hypothetical protein